MLPNFRDVGGVPCAGGTIRRGVLFRSAMPRATDDEPPGIRWAGTTVIDLRGEASHDDTDHELVRHGATVIHVPMSPSLDPRRRQPSDMVDTYRETATVDRPGFARIVRILAASDGPVLVHCAAGKDRTGLVVALLLTLAGVEREEVVADYLRTGEHRDEVLARVSGQLSQDDEWRALGLPFDLPEHALRGVLDLRASHPEGARGWLAEAGVDQVTLDQAVERLVDPI